MIKKKLLAILTAVAVMTTMGGCSFSNTDTSSGEEAATKKVTNPEDEMVVGSMVEAPSLDPAFNNDFGSYQVLNQICEPVLSIDKDGNVQDGLATYETKDNQTYVYTFKKGIKFSDGTEMTAKDAVFSIEHYMDPETAGNTAFIYAGVKSVKATGKYEMKLVLKQPDATWKAKLAGCYGLVFSEKAFKKVGKDKFGTADGGIVGTGAYKLSKWEMGVQTVLEKNENYHDADSVDIQKVTILYFSDNSSELMALKTGQIDEITEPDATMFEDIDKIDDVKHIRAESKAGVYLAMNCKTGPFQDKNVRKAVAYALDKQSLMVSQYGKEDVEEASSFYCPDGAIGYGKDIIEQSKKDVAQYEYDLEKAKEYLAKSDYADGFKCKIMCWGDTPSQNQCVAIQALLKELNISVEVVQQTIDENVAAGYGFTLDDDGNRVYDMFLATWSTDVNEPMEFYDPLLTTANMGKGGCNMASYSNTEVDKLIEIAKTSTDDTKRAQALADMNKIVTEDVPYVVVGYMKGNMALNKRFTYDNYSVSWISNLHYAEFKIAK